MLTLNDETTDEGKAFRADYENLVNNYDPADDQRWLRRYMAKRLQEVKADCGEYLSPGPKPKKRKLDKKVETPRPKGRKVEPEPNKNSNLAGWHGSCDAQSGNTADPLPVAHNPKGVTLMATYRTNTGPKKNGIEIIFEAKPSDQVRAELKEHRFRWHRMKKVWYGKSNPENLALAAKLSGGKFEQVEGETIEEKLARLERENEELKRTRQEPPARPEAEGPPAEFADIPVVAAELEHPGGIPAGAVGNGRLGAFGPVK